MTKYIFHTTGTNERWDNIAYKYYKNSYNIQSIIDSNPHAAISPVIKEGIILKIPIDVENKQNNKNALLPIWKQKE